VYAPGVYTPLINILFITLCALIAGCDGWKAIESFGREKSNEIKAIPILLKELNIAQ
jgi:hypothetical protein